MLKIIKKKLLKPIYLGILRRTPFLRSIYETEGTGCPANFKYFFFQKVLGFNRRVPWPVHFTSSVVGWEYMTVGVNCAPGASLANYIFAGPDSPLNVGDYTVIASGVCIAGYDHDIYDITRYKSKGGVSIGRYCWIGANVVVLSGVRLGDHTVVAAGSVVTQSFEEGACVVAGNPAKIIKRLDREKLVQYQHPFIYRGYKRQPQIRG